MRIFSKLRDRHFFSVLAALIRADQERLTSSTSRDSPSTRTRRKKDFRPLVLACIFFALPLSAFSQWIDEGEFSRAVLAHKLYQLKSQFEQAEAELLIRGMAESKLKKLELEDLYTRIRRLETEFQRGGYYPDLLDEQIVIVREDLRLILADPGQTGFDHNEADGQGQRLRGPASGVSRPTTQGMIEL
jgi:hypothetical protein